MIEDGKAADDDVLFSAVAYVGKRRDAVVLTNTEIVKIIDNITVAVSFANDITDVWRLYEIFFSFSRYG